MLSLGRCRQPVASSSDGVSGKPEPSDYGWMGARQRLRREETLFRGSRKPPKSLVPCTPRGEQVCSSAPTAERRLWLMPWLRSGTRFGPWPGDCLGSVGSHAASPASSAFPARRWADGPAAVLLPGAKSLGCYLSGGSFLVLSSTSSAEGRGRHPQRGGQLGQRELGGSELTAALLDVVDGHCQID